MTTLASATLDLARLITNVIESTATGGSATTLLDTSITEEDDHFNGGTIWVLSGDNAGKSRAITDWAKTTGTYTFATMTSSNAAGNLYAACVSDYPRSALIQSVNKALRSIGGIPTLYTHSTFVTVAGQEAYTLPEGVTKVVKVEIAMMTTAPYHYVPHYGWRQIGTQLLFDTERAWGESDYLIRLTHIAEPAWLDEDTDEISDYVHIDRLTWKAAVHALRWRVQLYQEDRPDLVKQLNEALAQEAKMDNLYPIPEIHRDAHLGGGYEMPV